MARTGNDMARTDIVDDPVVSRRLHLPLQSLYQLCLLVRTPS